MITTSGSSHCGTAAPPYFYLILSITFNMRCPSFFILVQYVILKLNASSRAPVHEKDAKVFLWHCALHSSSNVVCVCYAHAHLGRRVRVCWGERSLPLRQCRLWRVMRRMVISLGFRLRLNRPGPRGSTLLGRHLIRTSMSVIFFKFSFTANLWL